MRPVSKVLAVYSTVKHSRTTSPQDIDKSTSTGRRCLLFFTPLSCFTNRGLVVDCALLVTILELSMASINTLSEGKLRTPSKLFFLSLQYSTFKSLYSGYLQKRTLLRMWHHDMTLRSWLILVSRFLIPAIQIPKYRP